MAPKIDRLVRILEREFITPREFFNNMLEVLWELPTGEQQATFRALAGHSSERVREASAEVEGFVRNRERSRDLEHVLRNSPLRPGIRLELLGNPDHYGPNYRPAWLGGRDCCRATFVRFESQGENAAPVGLVEFDEAIDMPGHRGRYGVLYGKYSCEFAAWEDPEAEVALCVVETLPNDLPGFCDSHPFTDRCAYYRVLEMPDEPDGTLD